MVDGCRRRLLLATGALVAASGHAWAQRGSAHRIGFISPTAPGARNEAFRRGLRELGYIDGKDVVVEMRFAEGRPERLAGFVQELIRLDVEVLVVGATIGARAAKQATSTIPIVFAGSSDPVAGGIVTNLARPGGNVTGLSTAYGDGFAGKWLELLREIDPNLSQVAALWSSSNAAASRFIAELQTASPNLHARLDVHQAANLAELEKALAAIGSSGTQGLIVTPSPFAATQRRRLVQFAASKRLRAIYFDESFVDAGGLVSYGPSITDTYRQAASYVDKILKGANPGDLPVEQPTKFELVVNLRTAQALKLRIPPSILLRADRVIE